MFDPDLVFANPNWTGSQKQNRYRRFAKTMAEVMTELWRSAQEASSILADGWESGTVPSGEEWLGNTVLCWGVGPFLAVNIGYFGTTLALEAFIAAGFGQGYFIEYGVKGKSYKTRSSAMQKTWQEAIPFHKQLFNAVYNMLGPMALVNALISTVILSLLVPGPYQLPSLRKAALSFILLELIGDFGLYLGHRLLHTKYFWRFHEFHHSIETPSPVSTVCIDSVDATLQAGLPMAVATAIVRPHPYVFYVYCVLRLAENVVNHSGLEHPLINLLSLKFLPFRASVSHHDAHHKYSGHKQAAKNFAENFTIFDWFFGTLRTAKKEKKV